MSAIGVKKFMVCGGAGTLDDSKTGDNVLVPVAAVRDEGTSYHYIHPSREVAMNPDVLKKIERTLRAENVEYVPVKTWTTDGIFRETADRVALRKAEGCDVVEMECSAFYAVAEHKRLLLGQLLYAGDVVSHDEWNYRDWHTKYDKREKLFNLAVKCLLEL
jgi:uridine phosphorylase